MSATYPTHDPDWLSATLGSDASAGQGVFATWITPLIPGSRAVGPAFVAAGAQDDNQVIRRLLAGTLPPAGCILVVGGQNTSRSATIGGLLALEIQNAGFAGLVTDGLVRDSREIRQLGLPVWCRGVTPVASNKRDQGMIGSAVTIGGVLVREGDLIIADDDGVVAWPQENVALLLAKARQKLDADNTRLAQLEAAGKRF